MKTSLATTLTLTFFGFLFLFFRPNTAPTQEIVTITESQKDVILNFVPQKKYELFTQRSESEKTTPIKIAQETEYNSFIPSINPEALAGPYLIKQTSDEDIFLLQHPPEYLASLHAIQDLMVEEGVVDVQKKRIFNTEQEVLGFWGNEAFDFLSSKGIVNEYDRPGFMQGIGLVRALHLQEAAIFKGQASVPSNFKPENPLSVFSEFSSKLAEVVIPRAEAQTCFMSGVSGGPSGVNLVAPCCNCTIGGITPVPIGCLNAICIGRPAIFDQTTFICGCG